MLRIQLSDLGDDNSFRAIIPYDRLQVSPAPAIATFADVPTGHPFFRHAESPADSAIATGCAGGDYCPGQPVTRGPMEVFRSRALGLHWPN